MGEREGERVGERESSNDTGKWGSIEDNGLRSERD